jgi:hypothetical protein
MASYNNTGIRTFTAGEALEAYRRVKLSSGTVVYADEDEACIGFTERAVASGADVAVRLNNHPGTFLAVVNEAVSADASLYAGDDGKLQDTDPGAGTIRYTALTAGGADGAIIEVFPVTAV